MLVRATWSEKKEVHKLDKEQARRAGQLAEAIDTRSEIKKVLEKLLESTARNEVFGLRGNYKCDIYENDTGKEICSFRLKTDEIQTLIDNEDREIAKLESELEGI